MIYRVVNTRGKLQVSLLRLLTLNSALLTLFSCSVQKQISKSAKENILAAPVLQTAHVGISIYEPATGKYWFNYQGDHYFVPASNTKLPTCYAAMKYLGDSLVGARVEIMDSAIDLYPTGDPTFLHPDFKKQPLFSFLKGYNRIDIDFDSWREEALGSGWSWNDYNESYMAERSAFPMYGNLVNFSYIGKELTPSLKVEIESDSFYDSVFGEDSLDHALEKKRVKIERKIGENKFIVSPANGQFSALSIPFVTDGYFLSQLLIDTLKLNDGAFAMVGGETFFNHLPHKGMPIHSQPTDSLLKPMMHRSDNFFAEQSLLMVSNERLGYMNDAKIIDTLLKTDFKDLPQKPRWVDGSGLSRYNLFTPQDFVAILNKMKNEFGMERIKNILATGGEGTISSYFKTESGYIFAKTGTLSGVVALSGFLYTKKGKLLIFSTLVNNHNGSATDVRRAMEKFLQEIRNKY